MTPAEIAVLATLPHVVCHLDAEVRRLQAPPATDPQGAAVERLVAERDALRARAEQAEAQLAAIDSISEEAWEDGEAASWVCMIRNGEDLTGLPTQEAYEDSFYDYAPTTGDDTREEAPDAPAGSRPGPQG